MNCPVCGKEMIHALVVCAKWMLRDKQEQWLVEKQTPVMLCEEHSYVVTIPYDAMLQMTTEVQSMQKTLLTSSDQPLSVVVKAFEEIPGFVVTRIDEPDPGLKIVRGKR